MNSRLSVAAALHEGPGEAFASAPWARSRTQYLHGRPSRQGRRTTDPRRPQSRSTTAPEPPQGPRTIPKPGRIVGALDGPIATHCAPGRRGSNGARYLNVGSCSSAISIPPDSRRTVQNAPPCTPNFDQLEGFARSRTTLAVALELRGDHLLRARCARYHLGVFRSRASRRKFRPLHDPAAPKAAHAMDDAERANTRLGIELMPRSQPERSYEASGALHPARRLRAHQDADALRWRAERGSARVTKGPEERGGSQASAGVLRAHREEVRGEGLPHHAAGYEARTNVRRVQSVPARLRRRRTRRRPQTVSAFPS